MKENRLALVIFVFIALAVIFSVANYSILFIKVSQGNEAARLAEKENEPAKIELIKIVNSNCDGCFSIDTVIESVKKGNVNVLSEKTLEFSSDEAKQYIEKLKIEKLPTVIFLGEISKSSVSSLWDSNWRKDGTAAVFSSVTPPYSDPAGNIKGIVSLTHIIDDTCPECVDLGQVIDFLRQSGVKFSSEKRIDYKSGEAVELVEKFGVERIPAVIISKDVLEYPAVSEIWDQLDAEEKEGFYALHTSLPPYRNLSTDTIEGLVSVIYLQDESCASCYDVQVNREILLRFGLAVTNETTVETNTDSGEKLLEQYNITKVPIILISPDASAYPAFANVWLQVGDVAEDGWFVMRNPEVLGNYKDLESGLVVNRTI